MSEIDVYEALLKAAEQVVDSGQINPFNHSRVNVNKQCMAELWDAVAKVNAQNAKPGADDI